MDDNFIIFQEFLLNNHEIWQQYQPVFESWLASPTGVNCMKEYQTTFSDWITTDPNVEMEVTIYDLLMALLEPGDHTILLTRELSYWAAGWCLFSTALKQNPSPESLQSSLRRYFNPENEEELRQLVFNLSSLLPKSSSNPGDSPGVDGDDVARLSLEETSALVAEGTNEAARGSTTGTRGSITTSPLATRSLPYLSDSLPCGIIPTVSTRRIILEAGFKVVDELPSSVAQQNGAIINKSSEIATPSSSSLPADHNQQHHHQRFSVIPFPLDSHWDYKEVETVLCGAIHHAQRVFLTSLIQSNLYTNILHVSINIYISVAMTYHTRHSSLAMTSSELHQLIEHQLYLSIFPSSSIKFDRGDTQSDYNDNGDDTNGNSKQNRHSHHTSIPPRSNANDVRLLSRSLDLLILWFQQNKMIMGLLPSHMTELFGLTIATPLSQSSLPAGTEIVPVTAETFTLSNTYYNIITVALSRINALVKAKSPASRQANRTPSSQSRQPGSVLEIPKPEWIGVVSATIACWGVLKQLLVLLSSPSMSEKPSSTAAISHGNGGGKSDTTTDLSSDTQQPVDLIQDYYQTIIARSIAVVPNPDGTLAKRRSQLVKLFQSYCQHFSTLITYIFMVRTHMADQIRLAMEQYHSQLQAIETQGGGHTNAQNEQQQHQKHHKANEDSTPNTNNQLHSSVAQQELFHQVMSGLPLHVHGMHPLLLSVVRDFHAIEQYYSTHLTAKSSSSTPSSSKKGKKTSSLPSQHHHQKKQANRSISSPPPPFHEFSTTYYQDITSSQQYDQQAHHQLVTEMIEAYSSFHSNQSFTTFTKLVDDTEIAPRLISPQLVSTLFDNFGMLHELPLYTRELFSFLNSIIYITHQHRTTSGNENC